MSKQTEKDGSKKPPQATKNPAVSDDDDPTRKEEQFQGKPPKQQKDTIKVPERRDPLDDSGNFSATPDPLTETTLSPPPPVGAEKAEDPVDEEKASPSKTKGKRSPSLDKLKAGAGAIYKNVKDAVRKVLRSTSLSPKKAQPSGEGQSPSPAKEAKRKMSMMSMKSISPSTTYSHKDSGLTEASTLPESDTFDKGVPPIPSDESGDNLATGGQTEADKDQGGDADKTGEEEMDTDLPEADRSDKPDNQKK